MKNQNMMFTGTIPTWKPRLVRSALALVIAALIIHVSVLRAQAFDLSSLNGNYADSWQVLGPANDNRVLPPISTYSPYLTVALWTFDGAGSFTGNLVFNVGGGVILNPEFLPIVTGSYTVNANGTGTMNWMGGGLARQRHFVIGDGGNQVKYIASSTTEGHLYSGTMVKQ
jgi:hypothetical protein